MRLRRNKDDSQSTGVPGDWQHSAQPAAGQPGSRAKAPLAAPDRNAIRSVGVAIMPGVPLPEWVGGYQEQPPAAWAAPDMAPPQYADPRGMPPPQPVGPDPALAALVPPSATLPPPDPTQWAERPAGPVVWGPPPVSPQQAPAAAPAWPQPAAAGPPVTPGNPWFVHEDAPPPVTSAAGQYGWLVQPDVPASAAGASAGAGPAPAAPTPTPPWQLAPPTGPAMAPPTGPPAPPSAPAPSWPSVPQQSTGADPAFEPAGLPQQYDPDTETPAGPTSTTAPIAWARTETQGVSEPSATVAGATTPVSPWFPAEPALEPVGVAAVTAQADVAAKPSGAWMLAEPAQPAARVSAPETQHLGQPAMPLPTGPAYPLPPPGEVPSQGFGSAAGPSTGSAGWAGAPQSPSFASPPAGAWAPPAEMPQFPPPQYGDGSHADAQVAAAPEQGKEQGRAGSRGFRLLIVALAVAALLAVAAVVLFVTPGFLRSSDAATPPPAVQVPAQAAGLTKGAPAPAATTYLQRVADRTGAAATSQFGTYTGNGAIATVWVANAFGGSPTASALAFSQSGGPALEPLRPVPAGPRGGVMSCAAATPTRTLCFWNAEGVRGGAEVRGMGRAEAATLVGQMRVDLEPVSAG